MIKNKCLGYRFAQKKIKKFKKMTKIFQNIVDMYRYVC